MKSNDRSQKILHLNGSPFEIGHAMGRALGARLAANIERYIQARVPRGTAPDTEKWRSGALPWLRNLPARFLEEFAGLAAGSGLPLQRLAEWAYLEVLLSARCSGAILTVGNQIWVARNNDTFAPDLWGYVTIREIKERIPAISFGLEGDVFTPTGINRERLFITTTCPRGMPPPWAGPICPVTR